MSYKPYPKWLYRAERAVIVDDEAARDALDGNWYESPADVPAPDEEAVARAALIAAAEAKGFVVDGRWSDKRIAAEIAKAG